MKITIDLNEHEVAVIQLSRIIGRMNKANPYLISVCNKILLAVEKAKAKKRGKK